ncbi:hypothetical protein ACFE04_017178 [Oxalis oulophora]
MSVRVLSPVSSLALSVTGLGQNSIIQFPLSLTQLANSVDKAIPTLEEANRQVVRSLYDALNSGDNETVTKILAPDLEWWFHGPPTHQFMMRLLTGATSEDVDFKFIPQTITSFGPTVIAEGCDRSRSISWVHAWTVSSTTADGIIIITQVREYFNTSLLVTKIGGQSSSSTKSTAEITPVNFPSVWESTNWVGQSVPGLVLAI